MKTLIVFFPVLLFLAASPDSAGATPAPAKKPEHTEVAVQAQTKRDDTGKTAKAEEIQNDSSAADEATVDKTAARTLYKKSYVGENIVYNTKYEDTFAELARTYDLGFVELRAANPYTDPWLPGAGTEIILPARHLLPATEHDGIVINLPEMRLYAYLDSYEPPVTHPLGIGRDGLLTPVGTTTVIRKTEGPTWRPTRRMRREDPDLPAVVKPGPENPLGSHALYLGWPTYALHGTNRPFGIGRRVSSGCIRLYPKDIEVFYKQVPVGTKVTVIDQPIKAAWIDNEFYVEAHLTMTQADVMEEEGGLPSYDFSDKDMNVILKAAGDHAKNMDWRLIRKIVRRRAGYPVSVYKKPLVSDASGNDGKAGDSAKITDQKKKS